MNQIRAKIGTIFSPEYPSLRVDEQLQLNLTRRYGGGMIVNETFKFGVDLEASIVTYSPSRPRESTTIVLFQ
jgi:hypothetical protein